MSFRYRQFCPLARAAEVLGDRWTVLVLRELCCGPQRFSDLTRRLPGLSTSVLSDRLARLEGRGMVARRALPPPAPAVQYALTPLGDSARAVLRELTRFGVRFLEPLQEGDHLEPDWLRFGLACFAATTPTSALAVAIRIPAAAQDVRFRVVGGPGGTHVEAEDGPADVAFSAAPLPVLRLAAGQLDPVEASATGRICVDGDPERLRGFPALFDLQSLSARPTTG